MLILVFSKGSFLHTCMMYVYFGRKHIMFVLNSWFSLQRWRSTSILHQLLVTYCHASTGMDNHLRFGKPSQCVTSHSGQLSLLSSGGRGIYSATELCSWVRVKAGVTQSFCGCTCGWQLYTLCTRHSECNYWSQPGSQTSITRHLSVWFSCSSSLTVQDIF